MVKIAPNEYSKDETGNAAEFARFPYPLSPFQKHSIDAIVAGGSVLVTAHTGSGKTVPAEFAIQYFAERGKKVIYCSPIKALSNQKFYDFQRKFPQISVGLLTGDNKINPTGDCLVMTTEILMNFLFRRNQNQKQGQGQKQSEKQSPSLLDFNIDIDRELAAVVFDEVHYINDQHRGQVWEKTIMMLPAKVQLVMLSATIDNPVGFATWCEGCAQSENRDALNPDETEEEKAKKKEGEKRAITLCSTLKRVVPLGHYSFVTTTEALYKKVKDKATEQEIRRHTNVLRPLQTAEGRFQDETYNGVTSVLGHLAKHQLEMKRKYVVNRLLQHLTEESMTPALIFLFSRKQVEQVAAEITTDLLPFDSKVPYVARRDAEALIRDKLPNHAEYMQLPEYEFLVGLLEKGIGVHHAGMVPVFREIVELFIAKGYIRLLVATESFAIGLDCPIKSTIFLGFSKWDGDRDRTLMPHEYTQMAGRAGRRGIDTIGYVIHCNNLFRMPPVTEYKTLLSGRPEKFESKFAVSHELVLSLLHEPKSVSDIAAFVQDSMIAKDLEQKGAASLKVQRELQEQADKWLQELSARGVLDVCREYMKQAGQMQSKKGQKELAKLVADHPSVVKDSRLLAECEARQRAEREHADYLRTFVETQVETSCSILLELGVIEPDAFDSPDAFDPEGKLQKLPKAGKLRLTEDVGAMASRIREADGILLARLLMSTDYFAELDAAGIAGALSCFLELKDNVNNADALESLETNSAYRILDRFAKTVEEVEERFPDYYRRDRIALQPRLMRPFAEWATGCASEAECRAFVQQRLNDMEVSLGDFVKMVLKIVAIKKELEQICADRGLVALQAKLQDMELGISKFIMTSQSLYL